MYKMKFVAYGVEVHSPIMLPLDIPLGGVSDQVLNLQLVGPSNQKNIFSYQTPAAIIHGRQIQLSSNIDFSSSRTLNERHWKINIAGLCSFFWVNSSNTMIVEYENELDLEKFSFWLLHTIIPIYLVLKQSAIMLHAAAVEFDKKAILFIAPSFGGKSTLADFFIRQEHFLFSDDKIRLEYRDQGYFAFPSYSYMRAYREFETLGRITNKFSNRPLPIGNIYFLNHIEPGGDCSIEQILGLQKFEILNNAYLYEPVSISKIEMQYLMGLVRKCAVYQVNIPRDITRLSEVYQMIIEHEKSKEF
jgi:hypothetical protein